jgi:hypothetical protein
LPPPAGHDVTRNRVRNTAGYSINGTLEHPTPVCRRYSGCRQRYLLYSLRLLRFSSVSPSKCQDNYLDYAMTFSFQILSTLSRITPGSRDSSVDIETGCGVNGRGVGVRVPIGYRIVSPCRIDLLWGPPSLIPDRYQLRLVLTS